MHVSVCLKRESTTQKKEKEVYVCLCEAEVFSGRLPGGVRGGVFGWELLGC